MELSSRITRSDRPIEKKTQMNPPPASISTVCVGRELTDQSKYPDTYVDILDSYCLKPKKKKETFSLNGVHSSP